MTAGSNKNGFPWGFAGFVSLGLLACALIVPLAWAATWDSCTAFEMALLRRPARAALGARHPEKWRTPVSGRGHRSASGGLVGQRIARTEYPWFAERLSCTLLFWQVRIGR